LYSWLVTLYYAVLGELNLNPTITVYSLCDEMIAKIVHLYLLACIFLLLQPTF